MNDADQITIRWPHPNIDATLPLLKATNTGPRRTVVVLGAGMAGLVAAYELQRLGHHVTVLEGSDRVGGRVYTHYFNDGSHVELGAMRVPQSHDFTLHYIAEAGLKDTLIDFHNMVDKNFLDIRGVVCRRSDGARRIYPRYGLSGANPDHNLYPQYPGGAILGWLLTSMIETMTDAERHTIIHGGTGSRRLRYLDSLSIGDYLERVASADVCDLINAFTCIDDLRDKALSTWIRESLIGIGDRLYTLRGGMSELPKNLAKKLRRGTIRHRHEVTGLRVDSETSAVVHCMTPEGPKDFQAPFVICTIPYSVLRLLSLENFSYTKLMAIRDMWYVNSTKVGFACRHRFWESAYGIAAGSSLSDGPQRQTFYPMDHAARVRHHELPHSRRYVNIHGAPLGQTNIPLRKGADPREPGGLLAAYTWGTDADRLGSMSRHERTDLVKRGITRFHPEIDKYVVDDAHMVWSQNPWSAGAFACLLPGQLESSYMDARRPEGRIYFAGEHCSAEQAWIQGAAISAFQAVKNVVDA